MTADGSASAAELTPLFPSDDIPVILHALLKVSVGLVKTSETEHEDRVTDRVWKHALRIEPFRNGPLGLERESSVLDKDSPEDTPEGRIDLKVTCGSGPDVYFAIEAKRLRVRYSSGRLESCAPAYVKNGMARFVDIERYAPRMESGAMLGYVYDGDIPVARNDVSRAIEQYRDILRLRDGQGLCPSNILPGRNVDETVHDLDERDFTLFHLFVAV